MILTLEEFRSSLDVRRADYEHRGIFALEGHTAEIRNHPAAQKRKETRTMKMEEIIICVGATTRKKTTVVDKDLMLGGHLHLDGTID